MNFWDRICAVTPLWRISLGFICVLLVLSAFSFPFVSPGGETYYILLFNFAFLGVLLAVNSYLLYACKRLQRVDPDKIKQLDTFGNTSGSSSEEE